MRKMILSAVVLSVLSPVFVKAQGAKSNCAALLKTYSSESLRDDVVNLNATDLAPADFYDNVACECRLDPRQTMEDAAKKAMAAINAGLWAAEPMRHDLSAQEQKEAEAFTKWIEGRGRRPTMHGLLACAYSRATQ